MSKLIPVNIRLGESLYNSLYLYLAGRPESLNKMQTIQYLLICYLKSPQIFSPLEIKELREPMQRTITIQLPQELHEQMIDLAQSHQLKFSEIFRMAIYQELKAKDE